MVGCDLYKHTHTRKAVVDRRKKKAWTYMKKTEMIAHADFFLSYCTFVSMTATLKKVLIGNKQELNVSCLDGVSVYLKQITKCFYLASGFHQVAFPCSYSRLSRDQCQSISVLSRSIIKLYTSVRLMNL